MQARMADYDGSFKQWLVVLKEARPGLIPDRVDPMEDMSLRRLGGRAVTTEVQNNGLSKPKLEMHNCWKKVERAKRVRRRKWTCAGFGGAGLHVRAQQEDQIPKGYI